MNPKRKEKSKKELLYGFDLYDSDDDIERDYSLIYENIDFSNIKIESAPDDDFILEPKTQSVEYNKNDRLLDKMTKEEKVNYHKNHRKRVREKFLKYGLETFSEHEVLEMLLFYSISQKDTNVIAHKLIDKFGSLEGVLTANYFDLIKVEGISDVSASLIKFTRDIYQYVRTNSFEMWTDLSTDLKMGRFCANYFREHSEENLIMLTLSENRKLRCVDVISRGSETETGYYPRKIMKAIIKNNAKYIALSHNHPGGSIEPSSSDVAITEKLGQHLKDIGINLVDHIICSGDRFSSLFNRGYLRF